MPDYILSFVGHIIEEIRPIDFPTEVRHDFITRVENVEDLFKITNDQCATFIRQSGMIVFKDPNRVLFLEKSGSEKNLDNRIFVPMHMISYISTETKIMDSPVPDLEGPFNARSFN